MNVNSAYSTYPLTSEPPLNSGDSLLPISSAQEAIGASGSLLSGAPPYTDNSLTTDATSALAQQPSANDGSLSPEEIAKFRKFLDGLPSNFGNIPSQLPAPPNLQTESTAQGYADVNALLSSDDTPRHQDLGAASSSSSGSMQHNVQSNPQVSPIVQHLAPLILKKIEASQKDHLSAPQNNGQKRPAGDDLQPVNKQRKPNGNNYLALTRYNVSVLDASTTYFFEALREGNLLLLADAYSQLGGALLRLKGSRTLEADKDIHKLNGRVKETLTTHILGLLATHPSDTPQGKEIRDQIKLSKFPVWVKELADRINVRDKS